MRKWLLTAAVALAIGYVFYRNRKWAHEFDDQEIPS